MGIPSKGNFNKKEDIRQEDLLDLVEDLEKARRWLLVRVVEDFVAWGNLLKQAREMIVEFKRRRYTGESDCDCPDDEGKKEDEAKKELPALLDVLSEYTEAMRDIVAEGIRLMGRAGENVNSIVFLLRELRKKLKAEGLTKKIDCE
jgi:hypothetical protein